MGKKSIPAQSSCHMTSIRVRESGKSLTHLQHQAEINKWQAANTLCKLLRICENATTLEHAKLSSSHTEFAHPEIKHAKMAERREATRYPSVLTEVNYY